MNDREFSKQSAGGIMSPDFISISSDAPLSNALTLLQKAENLRGAAYAIFVTDQQGALIGQIDPRALFLVSESTLACQIMSADVISAYTGDDRETVAQLISKYALLSLPVVDSSNRLVGVVTADRALKVLNEEATEDIEKMMAIAPSDKPYLEIGVLRTWLSRAPWLLFLMLSATFTSSIIKHFESVLDSVVVLTAFIPMIMGSGGNAGAQSSVTVIRSLSLGEISPRNFFRIVWKELRVSLLCGLALCAVAFAKLMLFDRTGGDIAFTVALSLFATVILAKLTGASLPLLAKRLHLDPAVMANPIITTVVDALSLLIYFFIASQTLGI